jgi:hypothetical protein
MDPWIELALRGRIAAFSTEPQHVGDKPLPVDVPSDHALVVACREVGVPVYPVFEDGAL